MPDSPDPVTPSASPDPLSLPPSPSVPAPAAGVAVSPDTSSGLVLAPFRALRFDPARAGELTSLTSPPYDVIDADGVVALEASSIHNIVRLILPRELANGATGTPTDRYEAARALLDAWRAEGVLRPDDRPALYVYEQADLATADGHVQRGLVGALALSPPEDGIVLPHENTMAGPVSDRLALYTAVEADLEPIFLVYAGGGAASAAVADVESDPLAELLLDAPLPDGLRHRLWALTDPTRLAAIAQDLAGRTALIADGHHRYATSLARQADRRAAGAGAGPWDFGLTLLVDGSRFGPQVHPIHRVVPGRDAAELADRAAAGMRVEQLSTDLEGSLRTLDGVAGPAFLLVSPQGTTWLLSVPNPVAVGAALGPDRSADYAALDVAVLHGFVVTHLWDLVDTVDTVAYEHDVAAALAAAERTGGTAVLLKATPVGAVTAVAARGERMPRKSTLFTPKPRTGLVVRDHRDG